jgi:CRP-like cAMP-binding protein
LKIAELGSPEDQIRTYLARFAALPRASVDAFIAKGRRGLLAKGEPLVRLGEVDHRVAFLHSGIVRYHTIHPESGDDVTKDFSFAPQFSMSFGSLVREQPARVGVSAVLDCAVTLWPGLAWRAAIDGDPEWQKLGRKFAERLYVRKEDRELAFLLQSADERYDALFANFPAEVEQIPQHFLAAYMGVAPESLSRLKKRRKRES